jgi:hypothetical protein
MPLILFRSLLSCSDASYLVHNVIYPVQNPLVLFGSLIPCSERHLYCSDASCPIRTSHILFRTPLILFRSLLYCSDALYLVQNGTNSVQNVLYPVSNVTDIKAPVCRRVPTGFITIAFRYRSTAQCIHCHPVKDFPVLCQCTVAVFFYFLAEAIIYVSEFSCMIDSF